MVAHAHQHAHLHGGHGSLSHIANPNKGSKSHIVIPADKVKLNEGEGVNVKGPPVQLEGDRLKGSPLHHEAHEAESLKGPPLHHEASEKTGSLSHVHIPEHKKNGGSLSHIKVPEHKKNGGSLSHIKVPDNVEVDNKMEFIHKHPKDRLAELAGAHNDKAAYAASSAGPDLAGTPTAVASGKPTKVSKAEESYLRAKNQANRPHTWGQQSQSQSEAPHTHTRVVHTPLQTSRGAENTHSAATSEASSIATSASSAAVVTSAAASQSVMVGSGVHTTRQSASVEAAANHIPSSSSPALQQDSKSSSSGMSAGGSAGVAIGVILGLALLAGLGFFFWRRRKSQTGGDDKDVTDEKHGSFFGSNQADPSDNRGSVGSARSTASTAPRLSLRPVTQFLPNIGSQATEEKPKSGWERKQTNPFDDDATINEKQAQAAANPFDEGDGRKSPSEASTVTAVDGSESPESKNAAAAAGAPRGPNNVHRVQLDFKPTMDDELELKSGQIVRMLHEYDDGWALCVRMDRSQQGVCPRTCLSKLPVKPRPAPANGRPGPPQGAARGPSPPNSGNMVPRPLTPNGQQSRERSQTTSKASSPTSSVSSAASQGSPRNRSQSVSGGAAPAAVPSRKPVPGQAL